MSLATEDSSGAANDEPLPFTGIYIDLKRITSMHLYKTGTMSKRIICSTHKILELFGRKCQVDGCGKEYYFNNTTIGCCFSISAQCANGHSCKWLSSEKLSNASMDIYQDNLDFAAALVLSGNHFYKIQQLCQFFEMVFFLVHPFMLTNIYTFALLLRNSMKKSRHCM